MVALSVAILLLVVISVAYIRVRVPIWTIVVGAVLVGVSYLNSLNYIFLAGKYMSVQKRSGL